jgi:hypothetical protein
MWRIFAGDYTFWNYNWIESHCRKMLLLYFILWVLLFCFRIKWWCRSRSGGVKRTRPLRVITVFETGLKTKLVSIQPFFNSAIRYHIPCNHLAKAIKVIQAELPERDAHVSLHALSILSDFMHHGHLLKKVKQLKGVSTIYINLKFLYCMTWY